MVKWDIKADWHYKCELLGRSLHTNMEYAQETMRVLEKERCFDDGCKGQMRIHGTEGVWKDSDDDPQPRKVFYECIKCGKRWLHDIQQDQIYNW